MGWGSDIVPSFFSKYISICLFPLILLSLDFFFWVRLTVLGLGRKKWFSFAIIFLSWKNICGPKEIWPYLNYAGLKPWFQIVPMDSSAAPTAAQAQIPGQGTRPGDRPSEASLPGGSSLVHPGASCACRMCLCVGFFIFAERQHEASKHVLDYFRFWLK